MLVLFVILGKKQNKQTNPRNTTYQNLWDDADAAKVVLRGKLIAINPYIKKKERSQISNLTLHLKEPENE